MNRILGLASVVILVGLVIASAMTGVLVENRNRRIGR